MRRAGTSRWTIARAVRASNLLVAPRRGVSAAVVVGLVAGGLIAGGSSVANAAVGTLYEVTDTSACTFADALTASNTNTATGSCAAGSATASDTLNLGSGDFVGGVTISDDLTLVGQSTASTYITGGAPVVNVSGGDVRIETLRITGGNGGQASAPGGMNIAQGAKVELSGVRVTGNTGGSPGALTNVPGGPGGIRNAGELLLSTNLGGTTSIDHNAGGTGGSYVVPSPFGDGQPGSRGGAGGIENTSTGFLWLQNATISDNTGGFGGRGGPGDHARRYGGGMFCSVGDGGRGGDGGPGGVFVADGSRAQGVATLVYDNAGGTGGTGGAGGGAGDGCPGGFAGPAGDAGVSDIRKGGQNLLWDLPARALVGSTFAVTASSSAGITPALSADPPCTVEGSNVTVDASATPGTNCNVRADAPANDWFNAGSKSGQVQAGSLPTIEGTPPNGVRDDPYNFAFTVSGVPAPSVTLSQGAMPAGLTLTPAGVLSGTPVVEGTFTFQVTATNEFGSDSESVSLTVDLPDTDPPTVTLTPDRDPNTNGWYNAPVTFTVTGNDGDGSGVESCDSDITYADPDAEGAEVTGSCTDNNGNTASGTASLNYDATAPTLSACPTSYVPVGGTASVTADGGISGIDDSTTSHTMNSIGAHEVTFSASDLAGNGATRNCTVTVLAPFGSFQSPLPRETLAKSTSKIPVKFTLRNASGPLSEAASMAIANQLRVVLTATAPVNAGTPRLATASCSWNARNDNFQCNIKTPSLGTISNPYFLTVQERASTGGDWFNAPTLGGATGAQVNPVPIRFK